MAFNEPVTPEAIGDGAPAAPTAAEGDAEAVASDAGAADAGAAQKPACWDISYAPGETEDPEKSRFLRLHAAPGLASVHGTLVVIHGGYWKNKFGLDDPYGNAGTSSMAPFFQRCGFAAVELEYRRRDHDGGGWPGTNEDILAALRHLAELQASLRSGGTGLSLDEGCANAVRALRMDRLVLLGHSAGGCLALWAAHALAKAGGPCQVGMVLAMAPVADLQRGYELRVSDEGDAVELYMKCKPEDDRGRQQYLLASPAALLPATYPLLVVWGSKDVDVPPDLVSGYAAAATAGAPELVTSLEVEGADHFDVVNAGSNAWKTVIAPAISDFAARHLGEAAGQSLARL